MTTADEVEAILDTTFTLRVPRKSVYTVRDIKLNIAEDNNTYITVQWKLRLLGHKVAMGTRVAASKVEMRKIIEASFKLTNCLVRGHSIYDEDMECVEDIKSYIGELNRLQPNLVNEVHASMNVKVEGYVPENVQLVNMLMNMGQTKEEFIPIRHRRLHTYISGSRRLFDRTEPKYLARTYASELPTPDEDTVHDNLTIKEWLAIFYDVDNRDFDCSYSEMLLCPFVVPYLSASCIGNAIRAERDKGDYSFDGIHIKDNKLYYVDKAVGSYILNDVDASIGYLKSVSYPIEDIDLLVLHNSIIEKYKEL